jgi:hypothetical protein
MSNRFAALEKTLTKTCTATCYSILRIKDTSRIYEKKLKGCKLLFEVEKIKESRLNLSVCKIRAKLMEII